jgi:hypothetical protein
VLGWVFVLALCAMVASCLSGCATGLSVQPPPKQYRGIGLFAVATHPMADMPRICAGANMVQGGIAGTIDACEKNGVIHMPTPFEWSDPYAQLFGHEVGHALGWKH